ncbi:LysE family translocator [Rhodovibrionaceae bacterium A322]
MLSLFFQSMGIGFMVALPLGPIGLLCIERTLARGLATGLATGLGVALADGTYGLVVALGFASLAQFLQSQTLLISLVGGLGLAFLGLRGFLGASGKATAASGGGKGGSLLGAFLSVYLLTLANPSTILSFLAIFAALGIGTADPGFVASTATSAAPSATAADGTATGLADLGSSLSDGLLVVVGIVCGSLLWWIVLTGFVSWLRHKLSPGVILWLNRLAGLILVAFGLFFVLRALF